MKATHKSSLQTLLVTLFSLNMYDFCNKFVHVCGSWYAINDPFITRYSLYLIVIFTNQNHEWNQHYKKHSRNIVRIMHCYTCLSICHYIIFLSLIQNVQMETCHLKWSAVKLLQLLMHFKTLQITMYKYMLLMGLIKSFGLTWKSIFQPYSSMTRQYLIHVKDLKCALFSENKVDHLALLTVSRRLLKKLDVCQKKHDWRYSVDLFCDQCQNVLNLWWSQV